MKFSLTYIYTNMHTDDHLLLSVSLLGTRVSFVLGLDTSNSSRSSCHVPLATLASHHKYPRPLEPLTGMQICVKNTVV